MNASPTTPAFIAPDRLAVTSTAQNLTPGNGKPNPTPAPCSSPHTVR